MNDPRHALMESLGFQAIEGQFQIPRTFRQQVLEERSRLGAVLAGLDLLHHRARFRNQEP